MLCQLCENIKFIPNKFDKYEHHPTWKELLKSARSGCELCSLIERDFHLSMPLKYFDNHPTSLSPVFFTFSLYRGYLSALNVFIPSPPAGHDCLVRFSIFQNTEDRKIGSSELVAGCDIARSSASATCFQWAEQQIAHCLKDHTLCQQVSGSAARLPTRVLDLHCFEGSDDLRLHEPYGEEGSYATLSHCWGSAEKPLVTEMATLHLRRQRISFGDLPRSFQDAVVISRSLKFRYLWIDTLCIIQDSIEDWATESAQMARIYMSALLTISFTDYQDSYQPILCDRPELPSCRLGGDKSHVYVRSKYPCKGDITPQQTATMILELPGKILGRSSYLGRRAWAFQERLLSPRVLNYTAGQLVWECRQMAKCESNVVNVETHLKLPDVTFEKEPIYRYWLGVVESFSQCDLTFPRDKFPALSGIASEINALVADTYVAGLWKSDLHEALLWKPGENASPVAKYRAPSWSWASFDGDIRYDILREGFIGEDRVRQVFHRRDIVIFSHYIHPTTSDPLGMIDEASMTVRGYCAEADSVALTPGSKSVETIDLLPLPMPGKNGAVLSSWKFDTSTTQRISRRYVLLQVSRWALARKVAVGNVDYDDDTELVIEDLEIPYIATLILAEADEVGEYRRVGLAEIRDEHRGKIRWEQRELTLV